MLSTQLVLMEEFGFWTPVVSCAFFSTFLSHWSFSLDNRSCTVICLLMTTFWEFWCAMNMFYFGADGHDLDIKGGMLILSVCLFPLNFL